MAGLSVRGASLAAKHRHGIAVTWVWDCAIDGGTGLRFLSRPGMTTPAAQPPPLWRMPHTIRSYRIAPSHEHMTINHVLLLYLILVYQWDKHGIRWLMLDRGPTVAP